MLSQAVESPSSRRAWIEIFQPMPDAIAGSRVALLAEGVDRNKNKYLSDIMLELVALLAEGVDRNCQAVPYDLYDDRVALLAEGVDRNPSTLSRCPAAAVALLAEGVDRNFDRVAEGRCGGCRPPRGGRG